MSTPTLTKHTVPGVLGPILLDVRSGGRATPRPAVLVLHGFKGFKDWGMFPVLAERIARAGMTAVSFNLSGSGVDDGGDFSFPDQFGHATFSGDLRDLDTVVVALSEGGLGVPTPTSLGIVGHSRGGGAAVLHTAYDARVRALVTWSAVGSVARWSPEEIAQWRADGSLPIANARTGQVLPLYTDALDDIEENGAGSLNIAAAAAQITIPWLIVHGAEDETVPAHEADALAKANRRGDSQLLRIEGTGHTFGAAHPFQGSTPELERAIDATVAWMGRHLA
ncbi:MAG: alpha/beta fold hydrolase [Gemmatimonadales bacterium]|nr:alpha/beta fold hydrolase [Gemmatimonadales bacterium]